MAARRTIAQRTGQPMPTNNRQPPAPVAAAAAGKEPKMHPLAMLSLHEDRLNELENTVSLLQNTQPKQSKGGDDSAMLAECVKQIKYLTQENLTNRNLARELTLELFRLKSSLQEDGTLSSHVTEEEQQQFDAFKEKTTKQSQNVRDELLDGGITLSFNGSGTYDPNSL